MHFERSVVGLLNPRCEMGKYIGRNSRLYNHIFNISLRIINFILQTSMSKNLSYDIATLLKQIAEDNEKAFRVIFDHYKKLFHSTAFKMTRSAIMAEHMHKRFCPSQKQLTSSVARM